MALPTVNLVMYLQITLSAEMIYVRHIAKVRSVHVMSVHVHFEYSERKRIVEQILK
jgi:hypothetical protein